MATIFADGPRRHYLQQAVDNLVAQGFVIIALTDFHAELIRKHRRLLIITSTERITLDVDAYGRIQRTTH